VGAFLLSTSVVPKMPQIGDLIIILAAIQLGFTNSLAKRTMSKIPAEVISSMRLIFAAIFLLVAIPLLQGAGSFASISNGFWYVISSALLTSTFVFTFYKGIELSTPSLASIFFLLSAVVSAVLAYFVLGEILSLIQIIGGLLILVGAYFIGKSG
jgi:drug/metabolite transporter (DMT)-like permease